MDSNVECSVGSPAPQTLTWWSSGGGCGVIAHILHHTDKWGVLSLQQISELIAVSLKPDGNVHISSSLVYHVRHILNRMTNFLYRVIGCMFLIFSVPMIITMIVEVFAPFEVL